MRSDQRRACSIGPGETPCGRGRFCRLSLPAFSLLEVVAAIGIFAIGMVAVIGLFVPVARSVTSSSDAEAATKVAQLLKAELTRRVIFTNNTVSPFIPVTALFHNSTGRSHQLLDIDNDPNAAASAPTSPTSKLLYANRDGSKIAGFTDATWGGSNADKFFEIALIRNETLSPNDATADAAARVLAYTVRIRWPVVAGLNASGTVRFDHSQQQVMHFAGSLTR